jgi:biotin carboxyl carrier protein
MSGIRMMLAVTAMLALSGEAAAQLFKCTDVGGKVTYTSTTCRELGLKDAGTVQDRLQVTPAPVQPSATPSRQAPSASQQQAVEKPAAAEEAAKEPDRRCFTVTTKSGGKVTRCNDKPDEPAE